MSSHGRHCIYPYYRVQQCYKFFRSTGATLRYQHMPHGSRRMPLHQQIHVRRLRANTSNNDRIKATHQINTPEPSSLTLRISDPDYYDQKTAEPSHKATMVLMYRNRDDEWKTEMHGQSTHHRIETYHRRRITIGEETYSLSTANRYQAGQTWTTVVGA